MRGVALLLALALSIAAPACAQPLPGSVGLERTRTPRVIDGDTIRLDGQSIRNRHHVFFLHRATVPHLSAAPQY